MNQQVLARKWRPTKFEYLIGQDHVSKALRHALENRRLHHAYLFSGTRGVGKTTIARILVRCLNCEKGITADPCGVCTICLSIAENRFVDLLEVDGASRTKVDDTRELLENVSYSPVQGRYKVYLIDEVHMLSTHSFNALLKTLEEPPEHVLFLLATTNPQKLPPTVLSRCLQFHLRDVSTDQLSKHLEYILNEESVHFEREALWEIAKAGRGSVRDAITLLDQAIAHGQGQVTSYDVIQMLGTQGLAELPSVLGCVAEGEADKALQLIQRLSEQTPDWLSLVSGLQSLIHHVSVCQVANTAIQHLSPIDQKMVAELAKGMAPEFLQLAYQFTLTGYRDLPLSTDPRAAFEMMILRMIAFRPARNSEFVSSATFVSKPIEPEPSSPNLENNFLENNVQVSKVANIEFPSSFNDSVVETEKVDNLKKEMDGTGLARATIESDAKDAPIRSQELSGSVCDQIELSTANWARQAHQLGLQGLTGSLLKQTALVLLSKTEVVLAASAHTVDLLTEVHRKRIEDAFSQFCGTKLSLNIETRDTLPETPEAFATKVKNEALESARNSFQNDPFVKHLEQTYDAEISHQSIEPREI